MIREEVDRAGGRITYLDAVQDFLERNEEVEPEDTDNNSTDSAVCDQQNIGTKTGECAENFTLSDMSGEMVSLHDFNGQVIFLDVSSYTWGSCRSSGPSFNQFYVENQDRNLTSIVALYGSSIDEVSPWSEEIGGDTVLLFDEMQGVYNNFREAEGRPLYVVIDTDMTIIVKTNSQNSAEMKVLELLD